MTLHATYRPVRPQRPHHARKRATMRPRAGEKSCNQRLSFAAKKPQPRLHCSQQFSVVALTTSSGAIAERYAYSAYGAPTVCNASGTAIGSSPKDNRVTYTGREWDDELVLYHFRARLYDAGVGRFLGRDPIGYLASTNIFEATGASPLNHVDPSGYWQLPAGPSLNGPWPYEIWFRWWRDRHSWGNIEILKRGCIGVAATVCGAKNIEQFIESLDNCYKTLPAALKAADSLRCNHCIPEIPRVVAVQFNKFTWIQLPGRPLQPRDGSGILDDLDEPFNINDIWEYVDKGIVGPPWRGIRGAFDVQIQYGDCWLGADNGISISNPDMNVIEWPNLDEHLLLGDQQGYSRHIYCAECCNE